MNKTQIPPDIRELLEKCICSVCGHKFELGHTSSEYEYIRLNTEGECFPCIRSGQNLNGNAWEFFCSHDPEHDVTKVLTPGEDGELQDWIHENIN